MNRGTAARRLAALIGIAVLCLGACRTALADGEPLFQFPQTDLTVRTARGRVEHFRVWVADTRSRQEQGLMFLRDLDEHGGMLFVYRGNQMLSMWMKNTYIPLDMLFVDSQGRIDYIAPRTTPLSLDIISSPRPVSAVIELKGGATQRLGIAAGDQVTVGSGGPQR